MVAPTIDAFMAKIRNDGFANPSRYTVEIYRASINNNTIGPPQNLLGQTQDVMLNCEIVSIPGINLLSGERRYYGPTVKMPYGVLYTDLQLSFYCSEDHRERLYFENWINSIVDPVTRDVKFLDDYAANMTVTNYNNSNKVSLKADITKAFPISITPIDLGYSSTQQVEKIMVSMAYQRYKPLNYTFER